MSVHAYHDPNALQSALSLARVLWSAAETLRNDRTGRTAAYNTATNLWLGPHKDAFVSLYDDEHQKSTITEASLRAEALEWAAFWQSCTNLRSTRLHNERVQNWLSAHTVDEYGTSNAPGPAPSHPLDTGLPTPPVFSPPGPIFY